MNSTVDDSPQPLQNYFSYKDTFGDGNVWLPVPRTVTFLHSVDGTFDDDADEAVAAQDSPSNRLAMGQRGQDSTRLHKSSSPRTVMGTTPSMWPGSFVNSPATPSNLSPTSSQEAFLIRQFSQGPAKWMDLFDLKCFYAHEVPRRAKANVLLRTAACAVAAQRLSRLAPAEMPSPCPPLTKEEWSDRGVALYRQAIDLLKLAWHGQLPCSAEDLAIGTGVILDYESCDAHEKHSYRNEDGSSLIDLFGKATMNICGPLHEDQAMRSAIFWKFARDDFVSSLVAETQTRLDSEDRSLYEQAGLLLDQDGFCVSDPRNPPGEDMIANELIFLLSKLVNYGVAGDVPPREDRESPAWQGVNQMTIHERWTEIHAQFEVWRRHLPPSFEPSVHIPASERTSTLPEIWFASDIAASTMQWALTAQILLLINKPQVSTFGSLAFLGRTNLFARRTDYKTIALTVEEHARSICGIAIGRPGSSTRIHSIQPLFYAGQCLDGEEERNTVLDLLRDIQTDTGWCTDYRITQLRRIWGWNPTP